MPALWQSEFKSRFHDMNKYKGRIGKFELGAYAVEDGSTGFRVHQAGKPHDVYFVDSAEGLSKRLVDAEKNRYYWEKMKDSERKNVGRLLELAYRKTQRVMPTLEGEEKRTNEKALAILEKVRKVFAES